MAGIKDLAARTAGVTAREIAKGTEKEPRTAPVMMYDVTTRMHNAEQKSEELQRDLDAARIGSEPQKISLALIDDSPYQPRMMYDQSEIDNLSHSLAAAGQNEPVRLRMMPNGRYELVAGHRRTRAARNIGWEEITAEIIAITDRDAELATMVSNEARIDLTDYERGKMYQGAIAAGFAVTQNEVANLFGATQTIVSRRMAMLKLPKNFTDMLELRPDMFGHNCAESIAQLLKEHPTEAALIEDAVMRIAEEGADQKSVRPWVQQMVKQRAQPAAKNKAKVITSRSGRQVFTAKCEGRVITIRISDQNIDSDTTMEKMLDALRQIAEADKNK